MSNIVSFMIAMVPTQDSMDFVKKLKVEGHPEERYFISPVRHWILCGNCIILSDGMVGSPLINFFIHSFSTNSPLKRRSSVFSIDLTFFDNVFVSVRTFSHNKTEQYTRIRRGFALGEVTMCVLYAICKCKGVY